MILGKPLVLPQLTPSSNIDFPFAYIRFKTTQLWPGTPPFDPIARHPLKPAHLYRYKQIAIKED
jgi:hypothetical protein